jgi:hypothetical protein
MERAMTVIVTHVRFLLPKPMTLAEATAFFERTVLISTES